MKALLGSMVGNWLAFAVIAWLVRRGAPQNTAITCAYCGEAVPMATATKGGIGAVNRTMQDHMAICTRHPMAQMRDALRAVYTLTVYTLTLDRPRSVAYQDEVLNRIKQIAGRYQP